MKKKNKVQPYVSNTSLCIKHVDEKMHVLERPYVAVNPQVRRRSASPLVGLNKHASKGKLQAAVTGLFENLKDKRRSSYPVVKTCVNVPKHIACFLLISPSSTQVQDSVDEEKTRKGCRGFGFSF